jgi:hypothetical protein
MYRFCVSLSVATLLFFLANTVNAVPTPINSSLNLVANADAGAGVVTDTDTDSQAATVNPLSVSVDALAENDGPSVEARGSATASWVDAGAGTVAFRNIGWTTANSNVGASADVNAGTDFTYEFTAAADGDFWISYDITATGDVFGLNGFVVYWSGAGGNEDLSTLGGDPTGSGMFSRPLVSGQDYTLNIHNYANIFGGGGLGDLDNHLNGTFTFQVHEAIPEPATAVLGLLSVAGLTLRRRRTV